MNASKAFNHAAIIAGICIVLATWPAAFAAAHSVSQCIKDVKSFCGSDMDCYWAGAPLCFDHNHPGGAGNTNTVEPKYTTEKRRNFSKAKPVRKFRTQ